MPCPLYEGQCYFQTRYKNHDKKSKFFKNSFCMFSCDARSFRFFLSAILRELKNFPKAFQSIYFQVSLDNTSEIHSDFVWWKNQVSRNILKSNKVTTLFIRTLKYVSNLHNWPWKYGLIFSRRFSYIGKWLEARIWLTFVVVVYNSRICSVAQYKQGKVLTERQNKWPQNLQTPTGNEIRIL